MSIRLPNTTFTDDKSGRATWGRAVVDALRGLVSGKQDSNANLTSIAGLSLTGNSGDAIVVNAGEDGFELVAGGGGGGTTTNALTITNTGGAAAGATFNGSAAVTIDYSTVGAAASGHDHDADYSAIGHNHDSDYVQLAGDTMTGDLIVPDEAYGSGWNGSLEVPTKNAVYDKIESLSTGDLVFIGRTAVSAVTNVDIALPDGYDSFDIEFYLAPGTDNVGLRASITDDNFATVESGASDYSWSQFRYTSSTGLSADLDDSLFNLANSGQGNAAGEFNSGVIRVVNAKETTQTYVTGDFNYVSTAGEFGAVKFSGRYRGTQSINGLRLNYTSGTATGFYKVWGRLA